MLDSFHFDLSLVTPDDAHVSLYGDGGGSQGNMESTSSYSHGNVSGDDDVRSEEKLSEEMEEDDENGDLLKKKALALRIYRTIVKTILPNLQDALTKKVCL